MAGTTEGGKLAAKKNKELYGEDFYGVIGSKGGKLGRTGGFAAGEEGRKRAREAGAKGGTISRRGPAVYVSYKGERVTLSHLAKAEGISYRTAHAQMTAGKYEKI